MATAGDYAPSRSLPARLERRRVQWRTAAPLARTPDRPIITFTFDDFPKSAAEAGAAILEAADARATYYAASGLAGTRLVLGEMYDAGDLARLRASGHEIASHTHSHADCARRPLADSLADIAQGETNLRAMHAGHDTRQFAYPFGETTFALKRSLAGRYDCARGILPGINRKGSDRAQLRAIELGDDLSRIVRALDAIREVVRKPGWLIFYTHDVRENPSVYGVSPETLQQIVSAARASRADILPMQAAYARIMAGAT